MTIELEKKSPSEDSEELEEIDILRQPGQTIFDFPIIERILFSHRLWVIGFFVIATIVFAISAAKIKPDASLERMIPLEHPFIVNFLEHRGDLENLANFIRVSVEAKDGNIFSAEYMQALQKVSDEIFLLPGVDRSGVKSLWTPNVRWVEVTEEGFAGGPVIPNGYDGGADSLAKLKANVLRSGEVGRLVANDFRSTIVYAPLMERDPETGATLSYPEFSRKLEQSVREQYGGPDAPIKIHIVGFAKKVGDLIEGLGAIVLFFLITVAISFMLLFWYSRCLISSVVVVSCALMAVTWQLGLMQLIGYGLDPYSMLIPFISYAAATSHGVQFINGVNYEIGLGNTPMAASIRTFRHHYLPAFLALMSDVVSFATLVLIKIDVIRDLSIGANLGIIAIIATNIVLLPVLMSYFGVTNRAIRYAQLLQKRRTPLWRLVSNLARPPYAGRLIVITLLACGAALYIAQDLKIGELDSGAPELHPDSRYNLDNDFITRNYSTSADVLVVMVSTPAEQCNTYPVMDMMDRLQWELDHTEGVQASHSIANVSKGVTKAFNEGSYKWYELSRNQGIINTSLQNAPAGFINRDCSLAPVFVFLDDHRAETLISVVNVVEAFAARVNTDEIKFLLAAGNAGIEAATNQVIDDAQIEMMLFVYAAVAMMVWLAYRSFRAICVIILPLMVTSILCAAIMTKLGMGVKASTLPISALGVGLGVDYGIYIYSRIQDLQHEKLTLQMAYYHALRSTGRAIAFTGLSLAVGTATWIFSPIKFQSDIGILMTFMFLWNMVGALTLLPALSYYFLKSGGDKTDKDNEASPDEAVPDELKVRD